jgi:RNA polymerase sigma-70 factor (sigma-E family)
VIGAVNRADRAVPPGSGAGVPGRPARSDQAQRWSADDAVTELYRTEYRPLVRVAGLILRDVAEAEDVVQDAFVAMHGRWRRLRDPDRAVGYLRQCVVNGCRDRLRHAAVVARHPVHPEPDRASAEAAVLADLRGAALRQAIARLPERQRTALVLRFYADLSEAQIALAMGISAGSVKTHASRALAALRAATEDLA